MEPPSAPSRGPTHCLDSHHDAVLEVPKRKGIQDYKKSSLNRGKKGGKEEKKKAQKSRGKTEAEWVNGPERGEQKGVSKNN